jgi:predicted DNA-binding transcriptional regulator YafY
LKEIRTFGIDRLSDIEVGSLSKLKKENYTKHLDVFDTIIGLDHENNAKPFKVQLLVNGLQVNYLRSLPLHHSQVIHSKNEKGQYFIDFFLFPNYEFKSQILKMGNDAVVLHPKELKMEIKEILETTLNRYN